MAGRAPVTRAFAFLLGATVASIGADTGAHAHPPGDLVAYRWHAESQDGAYQVHPDGVTPKRRLAPTTPYFQSATTEMAISPDRGRVAFEGGTASRSNIFVADLTTGEVEQITFGRRMIQHPSWSPNGRMLVADCGRQICKMRSDGEGRTVKITHNRYPEANPVWSPDGTRIAFESRRGLLTIKPNGRRLRRLTRKRDDGSPRWSRDSGQIVFTRDSGTTGSLVLVNRNGSGRTRLTEAAGYDREPDWSPDGSAIVFVRTESDPSGVDELCSSIWTVERSGANPRQLTETCFPHTGYAAFFPVWSPDGERIAYTATTRPASGGESRGDIFSMNRDGSDVSNLTREEEINARYFGLDW